MKKFMVTAVVTGLIGGAASAQTNVVSSANIVGYVQTASPASNKLDIVSLVQFSAGSNSVNIQKAIANVSNLHSAAIITNADRLITWNGAVYTTYGLYKNGTNGPFWMVNGSGWTVPALAKPASNSFARGQAAWFQAANGASSTNVIFSGDVFQDQSYSMNLSGTLTLISYPYSADINLKDLVVSNATYASAITNADRIITWNGSVYTTYGFYKSGTNGPFWMVNGSGWTVPALAKPTTNVTVNLSKGFWYQTTNGVKPVGFSQIYQIN